MRAVCERVDSAQRPQCSERVRAVLASGFGSLIYLARPYPHVCPLVWAILLQEAVRPSNVLSLLDPVRLLRSVSREEPKADIVLRQP